MAKIILKRGEQDRILAGHTWVYDNEIAQEQGRLIPGEVADVCASNGDFLGKADVSPASKIRARLLTRFDEPIDENFFESRIRKAWAIRQRARLTQSCRVIFAEADGLPALIVDKFGDILSTQFLSAAMDARKEMICDILERVIGIQKIYERDDVPVREKEGLEQIKGYLRGRFDTRVIIDENDVKMLVDVENGQKTGHYLDQRLNRAAIKPFCGDARVLDCFSNTGGFSMHAGVYGAREIIAVDASETALHLVNENASINGINCIKTVCANAFDYLKSCQNAHETFDLIILDPPAFAKSRASLNAAHRGYKDINLRALKLLKAGGRLLTCSCSHYFELDMFFKMLREAVSDSGRNARLLEIRTQPPDHPALLNAGESLYLKCIICEVD